MVFVNSAWITDNSTTAPKKDAHPLPCIADTLEALHGSHFFSTLDMKARYWLIPIRVENKLKMAFWTSSGQLMECEVMLLVFL